MRRYAGCPQCGALVADAHIYCGQCGAKQADEPLTADYEIDFQSISTGAAHFGYSLTYQREGHAVTEKSWGSENRIQTWKIPEEIATKRALCAFLERAGLRA